MKTEKEKMTSQTKTQKVLEHLQEHGTITSWEAIQLYGATRLSAIIFTLRHRGYVIDTEREPFTDRFGSQQIFGTYIYRGLEEEMTTDEAETGADTENE